MYYIDLVNVKEKDEKLFENIPLGSGIDYTWVIED